MADKPYSVDFLQQITAVNFGGAWVLINAEISGEIVGSLTPPAFGSFSWELPKGVQLLGQKQIARQQHSNPGRGTKETEYFIWSNAGFPVPTADNYFTPIEFDVNPGFIVGSPVPPLSAFAQFFTYGSQFNSVSALSGIVPSFNSMSEAQSALGYANAAGAVEELFVYGPDIVNYFWGKGSEQKTTFPNSFAAYSLDITKPGTPSANTVFNVEYLFQVPADVTDFTFTAHVPANSSASGWASIFTNQRKAIKGVSDITGTADQSVYFPSGQSTFSIESKGKFKAGTISVNGAPGFVPGLAPNAPPSPVTGAGGG